MLPRLPERPYTPLRGTMAAKLAEDVVKAERWGFVGYGAVLAELASVPALLAATGISSLAELASNGNNPIVNIISLLSVSGLTAAACCIAPLLMTIGFGEKVLIHRRTKRMAQYLKNPNNPGYNPNNPLPNFEARRGRFSFASSALWLGQVVFNAGSIAVATAVGGAVGTFTLNPVLGGIAGVGTFAALHYPSFQHYRHRINAYTTAKGQLQRMP